MDHVNKQIRDIVADAITGLGALQTVSTNRAEDLLHADLPAAVVGTGSDTVTRWNKGTKDTGPEELRTIALTVAVIVDGDNGALDDELDALRSNIEFAVDFSLHDRVHEIRHTGGELDMASDEEGARWFAFMVLSWEVEVPTEVGVPTKALI